MILFRKVLPHQDVFHGKKINCPSEFSLCEIPKFPSLLVLGKMNDDGTMQVKFIGRSCETEMFSGVKDVDIVSVRVFRALIIYYIKLSRPRSLQFLTLDLSGDTGEIKGRWLKFEIVPSFIRLRNVFDKNLPAHFRVWNKKGVNCCFKVGLGSFD